MATPVRLPRYGVSKIFNEYADQVIEIYGSCPKAVFAAVAVSALTTGGDKLEQAADLFMDEWWALYDAQIVPQKPCFPRRDNVSHHGTEISARPAAKAVR